MPVNRERKTAAPVSRARAMLGGVETKSVSPVFVGRTAELATLIDAFARAGAGEPQALLIGGEAGVGKTRLVEEFAAAVRDRGGIVALGGCVEIGADGLPFAPFSTALRQLRRALPDQLTAAADGQEEELARLLPELAVAAAREARRDEQGMARLFELTARLLERVAAEHTVVLVLEDLHWADASTRHLLAYLFRTLRTGRLVVLATYRSDDIHRRHPLRPLLAELDRLRTVQRVELDRFSRAEVQRQIAGILDREPEPDRVDDIFERSDGNAFFVEELAVAADEGCPTGLTDSLRDLLLVRVENLPESAQRVVRIVAEGGSTVEDRLLAAVAGLGEDDLIEALRAAVNASILTPAPDRDGYRFRHSLVREAVSDDLLPGERSRLNRRFAEALEADPTLVPADERPTRLASYWYHAHDAAKALPAVLDASVAARRRHAYAEQLRLLERAMELWDAVPDTVRAGLRPLDHAEAYPAPAARLRRRRRRRDAAAAPPRPAGRGRRRRPPLRRTRTCPEAHQTGAAPPRRGPRPAARRLVLGAALPAHPGPRPRRRLGGTGHRAGTGARTAALRGARRGARPAAGWSMLHEPGPDAMAAAERAVEYARMVGAHDIELNARLTLGGLMADASDLSRPGSPRCTRSRSGRRNWASTPCWPAPSSTCPPCWKASAAPRRPYGSWRRASKSPVGWACWTPRGGCGATSQSPCCPSDAGRTPPAPRPARSGSSRAPSRAPAARCAWPISPTCGATPQERPAASPRPAPTSAPTTRCPSTPCRCSGSPSASPPPRAARRRPAPNCPPRSTPASRPAPSATPGPCCSPPPPPRPTGTATPRPNRAARTSSTGSAGRRGTSPPGFPCGRPTTSGCAPNCGARRAGATRTRGPRPWPRWSRWAGRTTSPASASGSPRRCWPPHGGEDQRARATSLLRLVDAVACHLGAAPLARDAALLARRGRLALTPAPRAETAPAPADPAEALGLTSRERDVLRLVAAGHTNRRIAEELFISPKTASVHVSNILAKLGVSGRGEAAAVAHRLGLFPDGLPDGLPEGPGHLATARQSV